MVNQMLCFAPQKAYLTKHFRNQIHQANTACTGDPYVITIQKWEFSRAYREVAGVASAFFSNIQVSSILCLQFVTS